MKFSCTKGNLEKALAIAERFTGKNITLPILGNLLLETERGYLKITSTNLEYAVQISVPGKEIKGGKVSVPAKVLYSLVQPIRDEKIDLEEKQNNLWIKTESVNTRINGNSTEDFPLVPKVNKSFSFSVDGFPLCSGLEKVLPAVSVSEFKPELTGIFFRVTPEALYLVATDTFRLAEKIIPWEGKESKDNFSFILPQKVSQEITRAFGEDSEVRVSYGENQAVFETERIKVLSRVIEGNFPEYSSIIPKRFEASAFLARDELISAVRSSSIFTSKIQEVRLSFSGKTIEVTSANPDVGDYKIFLPAANTGQSVKLGFNYRYLLDGLNALDEDEIYLGCNTESSASLLRNKSDNSFLYIIMPIRTD